MQSEPLYHWPARAKKIVEIAHDNGWTTRVTWADGPPQNVCVRYFKDGQQSAYAIWLETKWGWGRINGGPSVNQGQLIKYLNGEGVDDGTGTDSDGEPGGVESADAGSEAVRG